MDIPQELPDLNHPSNTSAAALLESVCATKHTTRDQRRDVQILHSNGFQATKIAKQLNLTPRQVRYAIQHPPTPKKRTGRPQKATSQEVEYLIQWICASKENRRCRWEDLSVAAGLPHLGYYAIRYALRKAGFRRRVARRKPPISEVNRQKRLQFAQEHLHWTQEQWKKILWSDETWVCAGRHTKTWVTRQSGEEWDPTCILEREQRKSGWMFWGCFNGDQKGPGIFWEKDWGSISSNSYCQHIIPIIEGWIRMNEREGQYLFFMQDNAKAHYAANTRQELQERRIQVIVWPPYSPDLNPIEMVWNWMKDYIQNHFGERMSYDRLRRAVREAWEAVPQEYLTELLESMPKRCQAVIDANGMHTKW